MPALAHLGIGFAVKRFCPKIPLWILLISSELIDLLSYILFFAPMWTHHGLFMSVVWSIITILITTVTIKYFNSKKEQEEEKYLTRKILFISLILGLVVFSHTILDMIGWPMKVILGDKAMGIPLLFDDSQTIGLGVYTTWPGALTMDFGFLILGILIYIQYIKKTKKG